MHSASDSCKRDVVSGRSHECPLVALTGATGLIGRHLLKELPKRGYKIRVLLRRPTMLPPIPCCVPTRLCGGPWSWPNLRRSRSPRW